MGYAYAFQFFKFGEGAAILYVLTIVCLVLAWLYLKLFFRDRRRPRASGRGRPRRRRRSLGGPAGGDARGSSCAPLAALTGAPGSPAARGASLGRHRRSPLAAVADLHLVVRPVPLARAHEPVAFGRPRAHAADR